MGVRSRYFTCEDLERRKKKHYFSSNQIVFTQTIKCLFKSDIIFNGHQQDQQMVL